MSILAIFLWGGVLIGDSWVYHDVRTLGTFLPLALAAAFWIFLVWNAWREAKP